MRTLTVDGIVRMPYDPAALPVLRGAPRARWRPEIKAWSWSVDDADLPRTLECAAAIGLEVAPDLLARLSAGTADTQATDARIRSIVSETGSTLYPYQVTGASWLSRRKRALLADDMGLGKTIQVLAALPDAPAVVVAPAAVLYSWAAEIERWRPDREAVVLRGRKALRRPVGAEIVIVSYESVDAEVDLSGCTLVVDEAHRVKSYKAQRSKAVKALAQRAAATWFLTGTPLLGKPFDLYGVLQSMCADREVFTSWPKFMELFGAHKDRWGGYQFGTPDPSVPERLRRVMLRRLKAEVMPELPAKTRTVRSVNGVPAGLSKRMDEIYARLAEDIETGTLPAFSEMSELRALLAESRIPAMIEIVEDYEESSTPLLVFSAYRKPIDTLAGREGWATITGDTPPAERAAIVERFQRGELRGVGLTIAAGGIGLTLTHASHVLFVDRDWTPALNTQAEDRVHRIGQTAESIQITILVSRHPLDERVSEVIEAKVRLIEAAVESTTRLDAGAIALAEAEAETRAKRIAELAREYPADRRAEIHAALRYLAGRCDGACVEDGAGFSKVDAYIGHQLADAATLSPAQAAIGARLCRTYRRQLARR